MVINDANNIEDWFEGIIEIARDGEGHLGHGFDLTKPCQIEVFWMDQPLEGQVFIITHDRDRPDKQTLVHGPIDGSSFVEEVEETIEADRWQQPMPPPRNSKPGRGPPSRADAFAPTIARFIERLEQSLFTDFSSDTVIFGGQRLWDDTFSHIFLGNIMDYEVAELFVVSTESDSEKQHEEEQNGDVEQENKKDESETVTAGGGYIYNPVWIERAPKSSFSEKVWGNKPYHYDKVYTTEIRDLKFHAYRDGLLLLNSDDGHEIQSMLNTLFAAGLFHQYRKWRTLLQREIYSAELEEGEIGNAGYEMSTPTGRNQLVKPSNRPSDHDRSLLPIRTLKRLIEIVNVIYPIHNLRGRSIFHLQAHSHLLDDEFEASFVLNWTVIEQLIDDLLNNHIQDSHNLEWENKVLEFAEITDLITESEYEILDEHRDKRNDIVHDIDSVSVREAEELDLLVSKLLSRNINYYLEQQDLKKINYRPDPIKFPNRKPEIRRELATI